MSLIAALEALVDAGATPAMMLAVARKMEAAREDALTKRHASDAARQSKRRDLMPSADEWYALRAEVFERDGYICTYCATPIQNPHCDHVLAVSRGGSTTLDNLVTACGSCNSSKGATLLEEWLAQR